ncbi:hypothetical protein [Cellulomonas xiejunii]|uniref:Uncharacterized protein n=1 Tax=Cellulomonas xiejunii TaxID=2968083 RepID=A0ABY5KNP6_9CELL|nr:hypothetical protein [Cellulomonas xiejunii]MCC2314999.1 hypothetical protein [Cellulomonas xiejunii]MCC2321534.1 hypothetical protein [Cellulomonas xiejunii]MCC2323314.1 hypothetical protein [Cellulomonas xiejunii]UUI72106.1 hypothetical protein NP048_01130 [Cellulomonas xiejunii]
MTRRTATVQPGDGHALTPYRPWQLLTRSLFHLHLTDPAGAPRTWSVDVRHGGDDADGEARADLYVDGLHHATAKLPAAFGVPDGTIDVASSGYGMRRIHHVRHDGSVRQLVPDPASAEGWRARLDRTHPALSRALALASASVLVVALVLGVPQVVEQLTAIPPVAQAVGAWTSPFRLSETANIALVVATIAASTERALRLRYSRILDGGFFGGDE